MTVKVRKLQDAFKNRVILPSSYGITTRREGNAGVYGLEGLRYIAVTFVPGAAATFAE